MKQRQPQASAPGTAPVGTAPTAEPDAQSQYGNAFLGEQLADQDEEHDHGHSHEPAPGDAAGGADLDATRPVNGDVPAATRDAVIASVSATARGATLVDAIRTARGDLSIPTKWSDQGTYHQRGSIFLDRHSDESHWQGSMAHELVHLLTFVSGQAANAATMTRDAFIAAKMTDEINAQATAYVVLMQSGRLEGETGLAEFSDWLAANHPDLAVSPGADTADAHWSEVSALATTWLEDKYRTEWTTSNTHENYYIYWGNYWDGVNPGP